MKITIITIPILILSLMALTPIKAQTIEVISVYDGSEDSAVYEGSEIKNPKRNNYNTCKVFDFGTKFNHHKHFHKHYKQARKHYSPNDQMPKRWRWRGGHWAGVGIHYNGLVQDIGNLSLPSGSEYLRQSPKSIGVNINFIDLTIVSNRHFGLITGIGLEMNNFRFDNNVGLTQGLNGVIVPDYSYDEEGVILTKSKLTTAYMNIPLLAEFQFGKVTSRGRGRGFVNFGAIAGIRLNGHTKVQYHDESGNRRTIKHSKGLNLRNFHYGAEINVGYYGVALSARYYPQSIFIDNGGPEVQQVNIGLSFVF